MLRSLVRSARVVSFVGIVMTAVVLGLARPAVAEWEPPATTLPTGFSAMVVDPATGRIFVSSSTANIVTVLNADRVVVASLAVPGAGAMLVHDGRLYVANEGAGRIDVFDTESLAAQAPAAEGLNQPRSLVWAGGRLWGTTGACQWATNRFFSVDVVTGAFTVSDPITSMTYCPELLASPVDAHAAFAYERGLTPTRVMRLDVSGGTPVVDASASIDGASAVQAAFAPAGTTVVIAGPGGQPYGLREIDFETLTPTTNAYQMANRPRAVAVDPVFGQTAGGAGDTSWTPDVQVYPSGWTHDFDTDNSHAALVDRGLAWHPDGRTLYAVTVDSSGAYRLHAIARTSFTFLSGSPTSETGAVVARRGERVTLRARVTSARSGDTVDMGGVLFRSTVGVELGRAPVVNGWATLETTELPVGQNGVVALYEGSRVARASQSDVMPVQVLKAQTTTTLHASSGTSTVAQAITLTATVGRVSPATEAIGGSVEFYDGSLHIGSAPVVGGQASLDWRLLIPGEHHLTATYSGDATYLSSASPALSHTVTLL